MLTLKATFEVTQSFGVSLIVITGPVKSAITLNCWLLKVPKSRVSGPKLPSFNAFNCTLPNSSTSRDRFSDPTPLSLKRALSRGSFARPRSTSSLDESTMRPLAPITGRTQSSHWPLRSSGLGCTSGSFWVIKIYSGKTTSRPALSVTRISTFV